MGKFIQRSLDAVKDIEKDVVSAPEAISTFIAQKIADPVINEAKTIVQYVDREVQVIKEVPVEVIKYVDKEVVRFIDRPVHIFKEKIVEVPVEVIRNIDRKVITLVNKVPNWCWLFMGAEILLNLLLIIK